MTELAGQAVRKSAGDVTVVEPEEGKLVSRDRDQAPLEPAPVIAADVPEVLIISRAPVVRRGPFTPARLPRRRPAEDAFRVDEVVPVLPLTEDLGGLNPDVVTEVLVDVSTDRGVVGVVMRDVGVDVIPGAADLLCEVPLQGVEVLIEHLTLSPPSSGVLRTHTASAWSLVVLGDLLASSEQDLVVLTPGSDPRGRDQDF